MVLSPRRFPSSWKIKFRIVKGFEFLSMLITGIFSAGGCRALPTWMNWSNAASIVMSSFVSGSVAPSVGSFLVSSVWTTSLLASVSGSLASTSGSCTSTGGTSSSDSDETDTSSLKF